jgi:hypothetical protein
MNIISLPLSEIKKPERNVRIHTEKQIQEFARSITMFGQIRPIVIDEDNTIMAGVGCYETLVSMGRAEGDFFRVEGLTDNQKKKLMITDNKIFGLGIDNLDTFNAFLDELRDDLDIPGYDESILRSMVAAAEEVSDMIGDYGKVGEKELAGMEAAPEKKETALSNPPAGATPDVTNDEPPSDEHADVEKSIICPHCGERIWL